MKLKTISLNFIYFPCFFRLNSSNIKGCFRGHLHFFPFFFCHLIWFRKCTEIGTCEFANFDAFDPNKSLLLSQFKMSFGPFGIYSVIGKGIISRVQTFSEYENLKNLTLWDISVSWWLPCPYHCINYAQICLSAEFPYYIQGII